jgi:hypothetical protein
MSHQGEGWGQSDGASGNACRLPGVDEEGSELAPATGTLEMPRSPLHSPSHSSRAPCSRDQRDILKLRPVVVGSAGSM